MIDITEDDRFLKLVERLDAVARAPDDPALMARATMDLDVCYRIVQTKRLLKMEGRLGS